MKKLLAVLLAGLMLIGFGPGASAQTPEELEAEGRALLAQTMGDLKGKYTIAGGLSFQDTRKDYVGVVHGDGAYAFLREDGVRDIHFKDRVLRVYPDRNAYHALSSSYSFDYLPLLTPKAIPASVTVARWYEATEVSFGGVRYWYKKDGLWSIDGGPSLEILINSLSKEADPDVFSLDGMREVPELQKWLWEPQEALALFLEEHPTLNKVFGKLLSAAITVLVTVFSPLLYLVILVLRVLFYFDLYKV